MVSATTFIYLLAAGLTGGFLWLFAPIARSIDLVDHPGGRRRHPQPVPLIGGISIVLALCLCALLSPFNLSEYRILFFSIIILCVVGILDDHRDISPSVKFLFQFLVASILIGFDDITVRYLGELFAAKGPQGLGLLAIPFTVLAIVGVINAVNMIDGHDGLAASCTLITLGAVVLLPGSVEQPELLAISLIVIASLTIFLAFNLTTSPILGGNRQVFLGDAGSVFLGLLIGYILIKLSDSGNFYSPDKVIPANAAPWFVGLPLLDMFTVLAARLFKRDSLVTGDRRHLHYLLSDRGWSRLRTLALLVSVHLVIVLIGFFGVLYHWPDYVLFWGFAALVICYIWSRALLIINSAD